MKKTRLIIPDSHILLVDDNRVSLKISKTLLETFSCTVTTAGSGNEALELIKSGEKYDLIFMDHLMPYMDGVETANAIWKSEGSNRTNIVALTAASDISVAKSLIEAGMCDFIPKPIELTKLTAVIEKWIPADRQIVLSENSMPGTGENGPALLDTEEGVARAFGDESAYADVLKMYESRAGDRINVILSSSDISEIMVAADSALALGTLAGTTLLNIELKELMEDIKKNGLEFDRGRIKNISSVSGLTENVISKYLAESAPMDILTF